MHYPYLSEATHAPDGSRNTITGRDYRHDPPLQCARAIRERCLHCMGGNAAEVRRCTARTPEPTKERHADPAGCYLWPYRMGGGKDKSRGAVKDSRLRSIRRECLNCCNGSSEAVRDCPAVYCHLWPYRLGRNPNQQGRRGASPERMAELRRKRSESANNPETSQQDATNAPTGA